MRCCVVFGVTLRLLVINISTFSPAINTAAYDGEHFLMICLSVLTQFTNVTDMQTHRHTHTDTQTPHDGIGRAYA